MTLYWIQIAGVRLAIAPRPRGGDWLADDIRELKSAGVEIVISALTPAETENLGLLEEAQCCEDNGLRFVSLPIEDMSVPDSLDHFEDLLAPVVRCLGEGKGVAIHCRAVIGRSSLIAASLMVRRGLLPDSAFRAIEKVRGCTVPETAEQRQWVEKLASHPRRTFW
jgi:protein-tyrosine phosphatase